MKLKEYAPAWYAITRLNLMRRRLTRMPPGDADLPVTVSLTTIPSRLRVVHLTLLSLLAQDRPPRRVVLWLHESLREQLPQRLARLRGDRIEFRFSDQNCSHRKLVHPLEQFPEDLVITVDDDLLYSPQCLAALYEDHLKHPDVVIGHECRVITRHSDGALLSYRGWPWEAHGGSGAGTLPIGFGGTLYPPGCLHADATRSDLYLDLAPKADDLWFKAMALRVGTMARRCGQPVPRPLPIPFSQKVSLQKDNVRRQGNEVQWQQLSDYFGLPL